MNFHLRVDDLNQGTPSLGIKQTLKKDRVIGTSPRGFHESKLKSNRASSHYLHTSSNFSNLGIRTGGNSEFLQVLSNTIEKLEENRNMPKSTTERSQQIMRSLNPKIIQSAKMKKNPLNPCRLKSGDSKGSKQSEKPMVNSKTEQMVQKILEENSSLKLQVWKRSNECDMLRTELETKDEEIVKLKKRIIDLEMRNPPGEVANEWDSRKRTLGETTGKGIMNRRKSPEGRQSQPSIFLENLNFERVDRIGPSTRKMRMPNSTFKNLLTKKTQEDVANESRLREKQSLKTVGEQPFQMIKPGSFSKRLKQSCESFEKSSKGSILNIKVPEVISPKPVPPPSTRPQSSLRSTKMKASSSSTK